MFDSFNFRKGNEPYMGIDSMKFRCYSSNEIKKLSVLRISQTQTFDKVANFPSFPLF